MTIDIHGVRVPELGFGTWELEPDDAERGVRDALELGYRHIDTAAMYGNEEAVGRAISQSEVDRDEIFVTTKVWMDDASRTDLIPAAEASLQRLGLDHVDLLLIHWPTDVAPIEETVEALDETRKRGWTRLIGVSNYTADQLRIACKVGPVATNQVEYHPFLSQDAVHTVCRDEGLFLTAYCPLAHGSVIGHPAMREIAEAHDVSEAQVALRWLVDHGDVAAIPRSRNRDHIASNSELDFELTDEDRARIDALPKDDRKVDPPFAPEWDAA